MRRMRLGCIAALTLCLASPAFAQKVPGVTDTTVTIGTTNPQTGGVAPTCKPVADGALAWFEKVNADGGVHGRKIINKVLDDQYTAPQALANARELADQVLAFFGGCGSIQVPAIQQVAKPDNIPYVFPTAGVVQVTGDANYRVIQPLYTDQYQGLAEWALKTYGVGKVFLVLQRVTSVQENAAAMKLGVANAGGTIVGEEAFVVNEADFTPLVLKIKAAKPDYLFFGTGPPDTARIVQTLQAQGAMPTKYMLADTNIINPAFLNPIGKIADGKMLSPQRTVPPTSEKAKSCIDAFAKYKPDLKAEGQSLFGCAMGQALVAALQDAGRNLTRESFMKAIDSWNGKVVSPLMPPITFAGGGHVGMNLMTVAGIKDGQLEEVPNVLIKLPSR